MRPRNRDFPHDLEETPTAGRGEAFSPPQIANGTASRHSSAVMRDTLVLICVGCGAEVYFSPGNTDEITYSRDVCGACTRRRDHRERE
jgi:hypothetical protein